MRSLLPGLDIDSTIKILDKINDTLHGEDTDLLLSLSIRYFHRGEDEIAQSRLDQAERQKPLDHNVMRVATFMAVALNSDDKKEICDKLLFYYPNDAWAVNMRKTAEHEENTGRVSLPPLDTEWEHLINQDC